MSTKYCRVSLYLRGNRSTTDEERKKIPSQDSGFSFVHPGTWFLPLLSLFLVCPYSDSILRAD